jgi:hypothetical protein
MPPSQGATHYIDDLALSLGLPYVRGASLEETLGEDSALDRTPPEGVQKCQKPEPF